MKYSQFVYELAQVLREAELDWIKKDVEDCDLEQDHFIYEAVKVMEFVNEWQDRR